jgi:alkylation response protein AidB-like acyl-CoA dehydrogenase
VRATIRTVSEPEFVVTESVNFQERVRSFLVSHAVDRGASVDEMEVPDDGLSAVDRAKAFQKAKFDAGLAGLTWPTEYGGQGLDGSFQTLYNDEASSFVTPDFIFTIGFGMCLPTVMTHGTEEIKQRYVPVGLQGAEIWCQLFSEPSAGSDVAGLQSRAILDGDEWILSGQKVWTTQAQFCDFGIVLARTNPDVPKHKGLSMFIVDMRAPGVTIRPLRQMNGGSSFNEVFFDDVRIPASHILGDPGEGWRVALTTLMNERVAIGAGRSTEDGDHMAPLQLQLDLATSRNLRGDPLVRQELVDLYIRYRVLDLIGLRIRSTVARGGIPGPEGSVAKLLAALLSRRSSDVAAFIAGMEASAWTSTDDAGYRAAQSVLTAPASAIAGGTSEVMRNILGERVLGLPKEPSVDRDVAFNKILR